jgi:hypothetical protein
MTNTHCTVTLLRLKNCSDPANPVVFRKLLPPSRMGHYWATAVEHFAKAREIPINWLLDNMTPEIVVSGPQMGELLRDAYGENDPYYRSTLLHLSSEKCFRVSAADF